MQLTVGTSRRCGDIGIRIWNSTRGSIVTPKRCTCAAEVCSGLLVIASRTGSMPGAWLVWWWYKTRGYILSCALQDIIDVISRTGLVGVLDRKTRLLAASKKVLILVVVIAVRFTVAIVVSVSVTSTRRLQVLDCPHASLSRLSAGGSWL